MNKLRQELQELLSATETIRPAALRRSLREDYLYATDLPQAADQAAVEGFIQRAENAGWHAERNAGWIQLDHSLVVFPEDGFQGPYGLEAGCCASLLRRHSGRGYRNGENEKRRLLKAAEEGQEAYESACAAIHREWAACLRTGEALPEIGERFFTEERNQ